MKIYKETPSDHILFFPSLFSHYFRNVIFVYGIYVS